MYRVSTTLVPCFFVVKLHLYIYIYAHMYIMAIASYGATGGSRPGSFSEDLKNKINECNAESLNMIVPEKIHKPCSHPGRFHGLATALSI